MVKDSGASFKAFKRSPSGRRAVYRVFPEMKRKTVVVFSLLVLALLLVAGVVGVLFIRDRSLPVYVQGELPPSQGYGNNTLTLGDVTYVSGKAEFRLIPLDQPFSIVWAIGRTADDMRIYRPTGQAGDDYIYTTGLMMPQMVYRNSRLAPLELRDMRVGEIRYLNGKGSPKTSQDTRLIREVMDSLTAQHPVMVYPDYDGGDQGSRLDFLPEQTPGLAYRVDVLIDKTGQVYLSTQTELSQDEWVPAGESFTQWVRP